MPNRLLATHPLDNQHLPKSEATWQTISTNSAKKYTHLSRHITSNPHSPHSLSQLLHLVRWLHPFHKLVIGTPHWSLTLWAAS